MPFKRFVKVLCYFFALIAMSSSLCFATDEPINFENRKSSFIHEFAISAESCIQRKDTTHAVFHGCIDWHSSVHAHWALLRAYRNNGNERFLHAALSTITNATMKEEWSYLMENPSFEMPYGRAWFLKLIVEYEVVTGDKTYRSMADYVAMSLLKYVVNREFDPTIREYDNLSWAAVQLYLYFKHTNELKNLEIVTRAVDNAVANPVSLDIDEVNSDFFSVWGNWAYLLSYVLPPEKLALWLNKENLSSKQLRPVLVQNSNHHLSINYSRAWGFSRIYKVTGINKYKKAYYDALENGLNNHKQYKDDYHAYGHWVPQFGIYALTIYDYE